MAVDKRSRVARTPTDAAAVEWNKMLQMNWSRLVFTVHRVCLVFAQTSGTSRLDVSHVFRYYDAVQYSFSGCWQAVNCCTLPWICQTLTILLAVDGKYCNELYSRNSTVVCMCEWYTEQYLCCLTLVDALMEIGR